MRYDFDHAPDRRNTDSAKWRQYDEDVLPLWVADMDFVSPAPVIQALRERVEHGVFGYPFGVFDDKGLPEFRRLIVDRLAERYDWRVQPEDLVFIPGVVAALYVACNAYAAPDEGILVQTPAYPPILNAPQTTQRVRREALLARRADGSYTVDVDAMTSAITPDTRLFVLCNPYNPVGRVFTRAELERMAQVCLERGLVICSDEIHCDLIYEGFRHTPIAPTKTFNLAGLQCSIAVIQSAELRQKYQQTRLGMVGWTNLIGLLAGEVAYRDGQEWLDQLLVYLEANRDFLFESVQRELPGVRMTKPEGTYLAWLDCRQAGIEGNPYEFFLREARVALGDGALFGPGGEGFVRLNFGCPRAVLVEALARMKRAL
jgi:cystathionine beta-lyase